MTNALFFWAQSLDNESPDMTKLGDKIIPDPQNFEVQENIKKLSQLSIKGEPCFFENGVTAFVTPFVSVEVLVKNESYFMLKVIPQERDNRGRLAPIICYGQISEEENWCDDVKNSLREFVDCDVKRSLSSEVEGAVKEGLQKVQEEYRNAVFRRKIAGITVVATAFVTTAAVAYHYYLLLPKLAAVGSHSLPLHETAAGSHSLPFYEKVIKIAKSSIKEVR